jgi:exodeoxyribonuclease VII small subunit
MIDEADVAELSFEDALKRLETIVARLESGDASLDESITLYAEGDRLRAQCEAGWPPDRRPTVRRGLIPWRAGGANWNRRWSASRAKSIAHSTCC